MSEDVVMAAAADFANARIKLREILKSEIPVGSRIRATHCRRLSSIRGEITEVEGVSYGTAVSCYRDPEIFIVTAEGKFHTINIVTDTWEFLSKKSVAEGSSEEGV